MEQRVSYISIYHRGHLQKGVEIFDADETKLQKKTFVFIQKMFIISTAINFKQ
jgi:hypothetical protein